MYIPQPPLPAIASTMDGRSEHISEHFANKYKELFNSVKAEEELCKLNVIINKRITNSSIIEVDKLTPSVIAEAVSHLKNETIV